MQAVKRNINIDLIKCIAVYLVISVHFLANIKLYQIIITKGTYPAIVFRSFFMVCVPLFIITTGYLMNNKKLSKKYYYSLFRVLIIYILDGLLYVLYKHIYYDELISIKYILYTIASFNVGYSWYIEMYLGLFLIIPFLNLIYNNLKNNKEKIILIFTMLTLTSIPGLFNTKEYWFPDWWIRLYPITYYFIGCYLSNNRIRINKLLNILLIVIIIIISSIININISKGQTFNFVLLNDWGSILNVMLSVLVFILIENINLDNINIRLKRIITKISELSLGIYLTSAVVDDYVYFIYYNGVDLKNALGYLKTVPLVFILSISLSMIINWIYKFINKYILEKYVKGIFIKIN